jgi:hypothetical protein
MSSMTPAAGDGAIRFSNLSASACRHDRSAGMGADSRRDCNGEADGSKASVRRAVGERMQRVLFVRLSLED